MPNIFSGKLRQIIYHNGKFYSQTKPNPAASFLPNLNQYEITPTPATLSYLEANDGTLYSIAIVKEFGQDGVYRRRIDHGTQVYEQCNDLQNTANWAPIDPQNQPTIASYFAWANVQEQPFSFASANDFPQGGPLSDGRKAYLNTMVLSGLPDSLDELAKNCKSRQEYNNCLKHLIDTTQPYPQNLLPETKSVLDNLLKYLNNEIPNLTDPLNSGQHYDGHFITVGERYTYIRAVLIAALKTQELTYQAPPLHLQGDQWKILSSATSNINQQLQNPIEAKQAQTILHAIAAIHTPTPAAPYGIKQNVTQQQLQEALKAFNDLNKVPYDSPLYRYLKPFLDVINYHDGDLTHVYDAANKTSLPLLHDAARNALTRLNQNTRLPAPAPTQFIALQVDSWGGVRRRASRADMVEFQRQHPNAILLLPDNFKDAALADNRRHLRKGTGGLAGPMGPQKVGGSDQNPIYDLSTFGIPTGSKTPISMSMDQQKNKVKEYFARLYGELARGRTIVAPKTASGWAFGGGEFAVSELSLFVRRQLNVLEDFCKGGTALANLDPLYQQAFNNPPAPPIPLPAPELAKLTPADSIPSAAPVRPAPAAAPPAPIPAPAPVPAPAANAPPGVQAEQKLTGAALRPRFQAWFEEKGFGTLTHDEKKQTLHGYLPGSIDVVVHGNKILLNKAGGEMTTNELKASITHIVRMHKEVNGNKPLKAYGKTEEERKIIRQIIRDEGIPLLKERAPKSSDTKTPGQSEGGMQLRL